VQTQTGSGFQTITRYFLVNGKEVTKAAYESAKSCNRGDIVEEQVRDASWSSWSQPQRVSGQPFLSPPRGWLRARGRLISEDPEAMPILRSLTFVARPPLITAGLRSEIHPREAALDTLQEFRFLIQPEGFSNEDTGFDVVRIDLPSGSNGAEFIRATVGGQGVDASGGIEKDTLVVLLPPPRVRRDSVEVWFRARLFRSPTVFTAFVSHADNGDNTQGVTPAAYGEDQVHVPQAVAGESLFRNLVHSEIFTPNLDGVNDVYKLRFTVVKTDRVPTVHIYSLDSRLVVRLEDSGAQPGRLRFLWDGRTAAGVAVAAGIYIVQISIKADAGQQVIDRLVHIIY
jgi:hypothetical protein